GYLIPTFLEAAAALGHAGLDRAVRMGDFLLRVRTAEGGVGHWSAADPSEIRPIVFDTGQVILGWNALWRQTKDDRYRTAALEATQWLASVQDPDGAWRSHQYLDVAKTIDARVASAMLETAKLHDDQAGVPWARRHLEWVLRQRLPNGFFTNAAFHPGSNPSLHTIAYTIDGTLSFAIETAWNEAIEMAVESARRLLNLHQSRGRLHAAYADDWKPTSRTRCLVGECQTALIWLACADVTGESVFRSGAVALLRGVASTQHLTTGVDGVRGGIAGSWPIWGSYERFKYPNWSVKFFMDGLLALGEAQWETE
ncbi:MAG: hypothetical protein OEY55_16000, partial [Acidimicrobiia bacterium]|nr:hypothetical protein [Acidimicrobiia bacterium]